MIDKSLLNKNEYPKSKVIRFFFILLNNKLSKFSHLKEQFYYHKVFDLWVHKADIKWSAVSTGTLGKTCQALYVVYGIKFLAVGGLKSTFL
jgi:hypothetical protein